MVPGEFAGISISISISISPILVLAQYGSISITMEEQEFAGIYIIGWSFISTAEHKIMLTTIIMI